MVRWLHLTGCALVALLIAPSVLAKPAFVSSVPNAATFGCNACHDSAFDPVTWNAFGVDLQETMVAGLPDWAAVCGLDSDGDGATNGEELADPDCEWVFGDSDPSGDVYDPSDPDATPPSDDPPPEDAGGSTDTPDAGGSGTTDEPDPVDPVQPTPSSGGGGCAGGPVLPLTGLSVLMVFAFMRRRLHV